MNVRRFSRIAALVSFLVFCGQPLLAQGIFATLTGVVSDPSNAVVRNAKVTLIDAASGSARDTVTNSDGYFTFASVPVGTYNLKVEAGGFKAIRPYRAGRRRKAQFERHSHGRRNQPDN